MREKKNNKTVWRRVHRSVIIGRHRCRRRRRLESFGADVNASPINEYYNVCIMCTRRRPVAMGTLPGRRSRFSCVFDRNVTYTYHALCNVVYYSPATRRRLVRPATGGLAGTLYIIIIYRRRASLSRLSVAILPPQRRVVRRLRAGVDVEIILNFPPPVTSLTDIIAIRYEINRYSTLVYTL